ncbi:glycosyltransferase [Candidatus Binatus sp.]|uniref:glycosyltransferase n=2 Tax=Candidatus Binatus sp. TaxID=2811406 RepID=UPI003CC63AB9
MMKMANESHTDRSLPRTRRAVLHLLTSRVFGGAEEHALSILTAMNAHGFEPCLAAPDALINAMEPGLSAAGVKCLPLEFSSKLDVLTGARLLRFIRRENIAILHCHLFTASFFGAGIARMAGVGAVLETCHGPEVWRMGKGLRASFWVDRQIGRMVDKYIAVSHAAERHLIRNKRVPKNKIRVIHNGRDLDRFACNNPDRRIKTRAALGLTDEPTLLTMARLDEQKGHRHLIDALATVAEKRPDLVTLLAGEGPLENSLRAQCATLGLGNRVRFLGYRRDVPELLEAADIVVLPSLYEGLPLVAIEALAAGRPMVATDVDGTPEVVIHERTGLLVPPANPLALAAAIERLNADPALAIRLASDGRKFVQENFAVQRQIEQTAALYSELTGLGREGEAA